MKKVSIVRYKNGVLQKLKDEIAEESLLHVELSSEISFDTIITPHHTKEFVYGNLYSEGFIKNKNEVKNYYEKKKKNLIFVRVKIKDFESAKKLLKRNYGIIWTECGSGSSISRRFKDRFQKITSIFKIDADSIPKINSEIKDKIELFRETGAYHYAFLLTEKIQTFCYAFDIGRHNAVDKVVGMALLKNEILNDKILFITGRISSDIVLKCLRTEIPIVISKSAPLLGAVELGRKYNLGIIGFLRGNRYNVYSGKDFINF